MGHFENEVCNFLKLSIKILKKSNYQKNPNAQKSKFKNQSTKIKCLHIQFKS